MGETLGGQRRERRGNVPGHIRSDVVMGVHHRPEAVQVNDLLVFQGVDPGRGKLLQFVADADNHIRLVEAEVDIIVHHEAHGAQGIGVIVRENPLAVKGRGHRDAELLGELDQGRLGLVAGGAVPRQDDGGFGGLKDRRRLGDLLGRRGLRRHRVDPQGLKRWVGGHHGHILGNGQVDRAGALPLGDAEGVADHLGRGRRGEERVGPLGHRLEHAHQVHHLVGLLVDPAQPHLGAHGHQRRAVGVGVGHPQEQVDGPGPQRGETHPGLAGHPAVQVGHERRRLLRAGQDKADG